MASLIIMPPMTRKSSSLFVCGTIWAGQNYLFLVHADSGEQMDQTNSEEMFFRRVLMLKSVLHFMRGRFRHNLTHCSRVKLVGDRVGEELAWRTFGVASEMLMERAMFARGQWAFQSQQQAWGGSQQRIPHKAFCPWTLLNKKDVGKFHERDWSLTGATLLFNVADSVRAATTQAAEAGPRNPTRSDDEQPDTLWCLIRSPGGYEMLKVCLDDWKLSTSFFAKVSPERSRCQP